jgi:hypothetical protein
MPRSEPEKRKIDYIIAIPWGSVFDFAATPAFAAWDATSVRSARIDAAGTDKKSVPNLIGTPRNGSPGRP